MWFLLFALICVYMFLDELSRGVEVKDLVKVPPRRKRRDGKRSRK